ncbi:hypothetical protein IW140_001310 [Coemansia sp. RSA 1813]|nr:hypothetical protein IW140_001310 [Coemansia sp. RSA 1813]
MVMHARTFTIFPSSEHPNHGFATITADNPPPSKQRADDAFKKMKIEIAQISLTPSVARVISKYAMTMESPRRYGDNKMQIMAAFQRPLPGNVIEPLYAYGISEIAQAFWMTQELGTVYQNEQPRPGLGWMSMHRMRGDCPQWKSLLETETANIRREGTDVRDAIVDVNAVR